MASPTKTCEADHIPTELLKKVLLAIIQLLTKLVNESLQTGEFPDDLKEALVKLLLKKISLEPILKNYKPVSNLPFIGKLMERCVIDQLMDHIHANNRMEPLQSAYKSCHSTETALLKVRADILKAVNNQEVTHLVLLDLSPTFDMVDHKILLNRLESLFGIKGMALRWIESYHTNQSQRVVIGDTNTTGAKSESISLKFGVPQGSVLGPIVFTLYMCLLDQMCAKQVQYHLYADDQQIYLSFKPGLAGVQSAQDDCICHMERCIEEIRNWVARNMLKLNDEKTEFIIFGTHQQLKKIGNITIRIGSKNIVPAEHVRNLGFLMDRLSKNTKHINYLSSLLCYQLRNIQNIRGKLNFDAAKTVVQALILCKLDYCNSLLVGTPECHLTLRVRECITYKIAYLVHCCKMGSAPQYLIDVLPIATHNCSLRSLASGNLPSAKCRTSLASEGSFGAAGPKIWNSIPSGVQSKKSSDGFRKC